MKITAEEKKLLLERRKAQADDAGKEAHAPKLSDVISNYKSAMEGLSDYESFFLDDVVKVSEFADDKELDKLADKADDLVISLKALSTKMLARVKKLQKKFK